MVDGSLAKALVLTAAFLEPPPVFRRGHVRAISAISSPVLTPVPQRLRSMRRAGTVRMSENLGDTPSWDQLFDRLPLNKRRALKEDAGGATAGTEETMTFFRDRSAECPGCNRVWLALLEKGVVFNERLVEPSLNEAYPAIASGGKFVSGWQECLDALEKIFPQVPLLPPAGSADRAAADEMLARAAAIAERLPPAAPTPRDRAGVLAAARGADALLAERGGDFALGGAFSLVDAALLPGLPLLEAEARLLDPAAAPLREAADELPAVARWLAAVDARVSSVQARVGSDALSQALRVSSAAGAESPEVSQAATRAIAALVSELDWREELSAEVPLTWTNFARRFPSAAKSPKLEAAAFLVHQRAAVVASIAARVPEISNGKSRPRPDGCGAPRVDLAIRLCAAALADAPDYGSSPTFANTFIATLLQDVSSDALVEVAESLAALRSGDVLLAPRDLGPTTLRVLRSHATWVASQVAKAIKKRVADEPIAAPKYKKSW